MGKRITIRGDIVEIEEYDTRFRVTLFERDEDYQRYYLDCYFSSEWENAILSLKCGQIITISGKFYKDYYGDDSYEIHDCEILRDKIISTAQETSGVSVQPRSVSLSEVVSVASIFREYEGNPIAAKRNYKDRRITVQGKAYNIVGNEQELWFRLGEHNEDDDDYKLECYFIECYFLPEWESIIHTLKEGQTITVNGEWRYCKDFKDFKADLHDCEIVIAE